MWYIQNTYLPVTSQTIELFKNVFLGTNKKKFPKLSNSRNSHSKLGFKMIKLSQEALKGAANNTPFFVRRELLTKETGEKC